MTPGILKDILLVLLGGFITFVFALLTLRIQRRQPSVVWRTFPSLHISKEGLSGISWLIESNGLMSAKNVRLTFLLPDKAKFSSFEVQTSEAALTYSQADDAGKGATRSIIIPVFTQGVSLSISSLISGLGTEKVKLSIVGDDTVGSEWNGVSIEDMAKRRRRFYKIYGAMYGVVIVLSVFTFFVNLSVTSDMIHYKNTELIADLYVKAKDYDTAISIYETFMKNRLYFVRSRTVFYELARLYALKGNSQKSVILLKQLDDKYYKGRIEQDTGFDTIRSTQEFKDYLKTI